MSSPTWFYCYRTLHGLEGNILLNTFHMSALPLALRLSELFACWHLLPQRIHFWTFWTSDEVLYSFAVTRVC